MSVWRVRLFAVIASLAVALSLLASAPPAHASLPVSGAVPKISGKVEVGSTLTAKPGKWKPASVKLSYQWYRKGKAIAGATGPKYTLVAADKGKVITVKVSGSKPGYKAVAKTSKKTKKVATGTITPRVPTIKGTAKVGVELRANAGAWRPADVRLKYQWYRSGKAIKSATRPVYRLVTADKGKTITVKVTGSKPGYKAVAKTSKKTKKVAAGSPPTPTPTSLANTRRPAIGGTAQPGFTLKADPGIWSDPDATFSYEWLLDGKVLDNYAFKPQYYVPTFEQLGHRLSVRVTATTKKESVTATSGEVTVMAPKAAVQKCPATTFEDFEAGVDFALALTAAGDVCGWGENGVGQLGTTTADYQDKPVKVQVPKSIRIAAGGKFGMALTAAGEVWTWGFNEFGQLGIEDPDSLLPLEGDGYRVNTPLSFVPRKVAGLPRIASIAAAAGTAVAVAADGAVYTWGEYQTATPGGTSGGAITSPKKLPGLSGIVKAATDGERFLALDRSGAVLQWGTWPARYRNDDGSIATDGGWIEFETTGSAKAVRMLSGHKATDIALNGYAAYALTDAGRVYAWGAGGGLGRLLPMVALGSGLVLQPVEFTKLPNAKALHAGGSSAAAELTDGRIAYWGEPGDPFAHYQSEPLGDSGARVITSPALRPSALGFVGSWAGGLTTSGGFVHLFSEPLNTYDGYPFRTADHPGGTVEFKRLEITEARKQSCSNGYLYETRADIPLVVVAELDYGDGPLRPSRVEYLKFGGDVVTPYGGASVDCKGTFTLKLTLRTTSAWTWAPDGKSWSKTAKRPWS